VEDDGRLRTQWAAALRASDLTVSEASTCSGALGLIQRNTVDVLILDWHLGNEKANVVLDTWVTYTRGGPACVVSGSADRAEMRDLYSRGAHHVIEKPTDLGTLLTIIRRYSSEIITRKEVAHLKGEVKRLRRAVVILAILAAAVGAGSSEVLGYILALL
jgi:DNA-binding NtrC family response regulator